MNEKENKSKNIETILNENCVWNSAAQQQLTAAAFGRKSSHFIRTRRDTMISVERFMMNNE